MIDKFQVFAKLLLANHWLMGKIIKNPTTQNNTVKITFFVRLLRSLIWRELPLMKNVLMPLVKSVMVPLGLTAVDEVILKKTLQPGASGSEKHY